MIYLRHHLDGHALYRSAYIDVGCGRCSSIFVPSRSDSISTPSPTSHLVADSPTQPSISSSRHTFLFYRQGGTLFCCLDSIVHTDFYVICLRKAGIHLGVYFWYCFWPDLVLLFISWNIWVLSPCSREALCFLFRISFLFSFIPLSGEIED